MKKAAALSFLLVSAFHFRAEAFLQMQSFKPISTASQVIVVGGSLVTVPTGTVAVFIMDEGSGNSVYELNDPGIVGQVLPGAVFNSTGGARGQPAVTNTNTTGYVSVPAADASWAAGHAGTANVGEQTVMMCVEPRTSVAQAAHPFGFWSHEDNSGTKYAYTIFYQSGETLNSRLSTSVGGGVSTFITTSTVLNLGKRNSIVARGDKTQTQALSTRIFVNKNLMSGNASGTLNTTTDPNVDLRFGLQGADSSSYSNSNLSFYIYLTRNVTQADINAFHDDCSALAP